jgi:hypothetical protein
MNTSGIEILSGQDNAEQRNISALQLRDRDALNFGLVLFKDCDELFVARILFTNALFVRKGNIRNAAVLRFAAVFHNEMDTIADNDSHRIDPRLSASLTDGGLPCPAQASAARWLKPSSMALAFSSSCYSSDWELISGSDLQVSVTPYSGPLPPALRRAGAW